MRERENVILPTADFDLIIETSRILGLPAYVIAHSRMDCFQRVYACARTRYTRRRSNISHIRVFARMQKKADRTR